MNSYLPSFDPKRLRRADAVAGFESIPAIANGMLFFGNTACLVSDRSLQALTDRLHERLDDTQFILASLDGRNDGGWLRPAVWTFMEQPQPVGGHRADGIGRGEH